MKRLLFFYTRPLDCVGLAREFHRKSELFGIHPPDSPRRPTRFSIELSLLDKLKPSGETYKIQTIESTSY